jgi:thiamine biosynthesis lipoprotein
MLRLLHHWKYGLKLALLGLVFFNTACEPSSQIYSFSGNTMGTTYHVKVVYQQLPTDPKSLQQHMDAILEDINALMSTYRVDSELSKFNQMAQGRMSLSHDTSLVLREALRLHDLTNGALDVSVGSLVNLWGFGPHQKPMKMPSDAVIADRKLTTGLQHLRPYPNNIYEKLLSGLQLDLSAIAKGFGVDELARYLLTTGASGYMVEIGGETKTFGHKNTGEPWRIAIEQPTVATRNIALIIEPGDFAMATSGDYRNYYEVDGQRQSHILDPRTGHPVTHHLASVTVLDSNCMTADGLATAMMVMGTDAALRLANQHQIPVMLISHQSNQFEMIYSEAFKPFLHKQ